MMTLEFSDGAMAAYAALYSSANDIDIYVEDRTLAGLYEMIFRSVLGESIRLSAVTPLGPRSNVVDEAIRLSNDYTRKRFFLIDGDFHWFDPNQPRIRDLYCLNCYSIENFTWHYTAVIDAAKVLAPELGHADIVQRLPVSLFANFERDMRSLFIMYAVCMRLNGTCSTVSYSLIRLIDRKALLVDKTAVSSRIKEIYTHLLQTHSISVIAQVRRNVVEHLNLKGGVDHRLISGKDYLIQFIMLVMQEKFGFKGNPRQLASIIIDRSDLKVDPDFRRAVLSCLGPNPPNP